MDDLNQNSSRRLKRSQRAGSIRIIIGLAVIAGIVAGVRLLAYTGKPTTTTAASAPPSPVPVTAAVATRRDVPEIVNAIGNVQSIDSVSVLPRVTGTIQKIEFTPGQDVKKGQELFLIDPRPYQAALDQAKAQLAHDQGVLAEAQMDLRRYQTLASKKAINAQQAQDQVYVVQQDQGTVQVDQANIEMAQLNLDYCHIGAPITGRAGTLQVDLGNLVGPSAASSNSAKSTSSAQTSTASTTSSATNALVSIVQLKPIYVSFSIPQTALNEIINAQAKTPLDVVAYSQAGSLLERGKLTVINNQVSTTTGTATLQATFANDGDVLWPGAYVSVQLVVGTRHNVVTVPASAVMEGPNGDYVYVIGPDDSVKRVDIQQAARRGGISVVSKGIAAGQEVVATGQYRLDNGTHVVVEPTTASQQPARTGADSTPATVDKSQ
jgi:membrane fusion protein, multidrug efflux system